MSVKKKQLLTATLLIALTAAVAVNWYYTNNTPIIGNDSVSDYSEENSLGNSLLVAGTVSNEDGTATEDSLQTAANMNTDTYFSEAKLKRTQSHDEILEEIEDFIEDDSLNAEDKSALTQMISDFKNNVKKETDIENLIKAKISGQVLVVLNDGAGSVVVEKGTLNDTVIMQITDIFEKNTDISAENLTIIEAK